jgi:hypothetical protein
VKYGKSSLTISAKTVGVGVVSQPWIRELMENALTAIAPLLYAFSGRVARGFAES